MAAKRLNLATVRPGEIPREDFMRPMALSINGLARALGTPPELWMGLQADYELDLARDTMTARIEKEVLPRAS